jgi:hypothetical protein
MVSPRCLLLSIAVAGALAVPRLEVAPKPNTTCKYARTQTPHAPKQGKWATRPTVNKSRIITNPVTNTSHARAPPPTRRSVLWPRLRLVSFSRLEVDAIDARGCVKCQTTKPLPQAATKLLPGLLMRARLPHPQCFMGGFTVAAHPPSFPTCW